MLNQKFLPGLNAVRVLCCLSSLFYWRLGLSENCIYNLLTGEYRKRNEKMLLKMEKWSPWQYISQVAAVCIANIPEYLE